MTRYYFDFRIGTQPIELDHEGLDFADFAVAREQALRALVEVAADRSADFIEDREILVQIRDEHHTRCEYRISLSQDGHASLERLVVKFSQSTMNLWNKGSVSELLLRIERSVEEFPPFLLKGTSMKVALVAAALALSFAATPVFAQSGTAGASGSNNASGNSNQPVVTTDEGKTSSTGTNEGMTEADKQFYADNKMFSGFWTDDSMTTMKSDEEIASAWQAMTAEDQAAANSACGTVNGNRGAYSPATTGMCDRIGGLGK